jgi:ABC-type amino acid transport substrate-binding protein
MIEEPVELEPYVIAMPRQDINMRNLVNGTLQYLQREGKLAALRQTYFPEVTYDDVAVWDGLGEGAPKPADFSAPVTFPQQYVLPRLQNDRTLRVAGIKGLTVNDTDIAESERRLEIFHRQLMDAIAQRWGVSIQYIPADPEQALELVRTGEADIALGIEPNWAWTDRVDFTGAYLLRGLRLMVTKNSNIFGFEQLGGSKWIAVTTADANVREEVFANAQRANVLVEVLETSEGNFAQTILEDSNADVAFADSLRLLPYLETHADDFQLTERWYTRDYLSMAVPRNDLDFRLLLNYTLQEMVRDGSLGELLKPVTPPNDAPAFDVWPGSGSTFGFSISR